jgi:hypothetical protein
MGVRGLLSYIVQNQDSGAVRFDDLAADARKGQVRLLIDVSSFASWLFRLLQEQDRPSAVFGGNLSFYDHAMTVVISRFAELGIVPEFFHDAGGMSVLDAYPQEAANWRRRVEKHRTGARQFRGWCRGESGLLKADSVPPAPLIASQLCASVRRAGCQMWSLVDSHAAPMIVAEESGRGMDREMRSMYWGVLTDNTDFALTVSAKMIPVALFDRDNSVWGGGTTLKVGWTSCDLLAEHLRIGHPPKPGEEPFTDKGGKPRSPWFPRTLREIMLLVGTDQTYPHLLKNQVWRQLDVQPDIVSIIKWVRERVYNERMRWSKITLRDLHPVLEKFEEDIEWTTACRLQRALFEHKPKIVERALSEYGYTYAEVQARLPKRLPERLQNLSEQARISSFASAGKTGVV